MIKKQIQNQLLGMMNNEILIKYSLGRNKYEEYSAKIKEVYKNIFIVETSEGITKSFSYYDIINKTVKIKIIS